MLHPKSSARSSKLRALLEKVLSGKEKISGSNARLFLEAVCGQENKALCVQKLAASPYSQTALQSALCSDISITFLNGPVTSFLHFLGAPELRTVCGGDVLRRLLLNFVELTLVFEAFAAAFSREELIAEGEMAFSWLLLQLVSLPKEKAVAYAHLALEEQIRERLLKSSYQEVRLQARRIIHIVDNLSANHETLSNGPGGRHDNDFVEIQKIEILPTCDELAAKDPYLPRAHEVNERASFPNGLAIHLDSQFRLLREDMLRDLREEVQIALNVRKGRRKGLSVEGLTMVGVQSDKRNPWSLQMRCIQDLAQMTHKKEQDRRKFLRDNSKFLRHESVICIMADDEVLTLGTLVRDEDLLVKKPPILCLQIPATEMERVLRRFKSSKNLKVIQLSTAAFAYVPILKQLQEIKEISLEDEILHWKPDSRLRAPGYQLSPELEALLDEVKIDPSFDLSDALRLSCATNLDKAQALCFISGIGQTLSLIQGPPGTGKSFIGSLIAKAIHVHSNEKILIVCAKHHALDQFLEDLLGLGISEADIVRLGSVKKATPRTQPLGITKAAFSVKLTRDQCQMLNTAKIEAIDEGDRLEQSFSDFEQASFSKDDILEHLEFKPGVSFYDAFQVPNEQGGITKLGKKGKAVDRFYLLDRWWRGKDAGIFKKKASTFPEVWEIKSPERIKAQRLWETEMLSERLDAIKRSGIGYNDAVDRIDSIYMEKDITIMRSRRIIACTTTAAAKYVQKLKSVHPGVLLVEEAGEILESHILTALSPDTKQLILIGDHKQLRPKVHYDLSVEKADGYDLNRSLFERLISRGYPYCVLNQQHRMRPELAEFVRELNYPDLVDAPSTKKRPDIQGLQDNIIFLSHSQNEIDTKDIPDWKDTTAISSKKNPFEAKLALKCVRYLGQQDYKTDNIVVLTPYLGQLRLLMDELSKDNDPVLSDLDSHDLVRAGLMPAATAQVAKPRIRISTIDNFQGDESDIAIVSLTRSNPQHEIGFMSSPQRLNVLLSRARDGLIILGDVETFMQSKKGGELWKRFVTMLKNKNHIYDGLPVKCERHPKRTALLRTPEDFDKECPDGGCQEPCGSTLNCGVHKCPRSCHHRPDHSGMKCEKAVEFKCANGHLQKRKCSQSQPQICRICEVEDERRQKELEADVELQDRRDKAHAQHLKNIGDLELRIRRIREEEADRKTSVQRARALEQKKRDLDTAKLLAQRSLTADVDPEQTDDKSKGTKASQLQSASQSSPVHSHPNPDPKPKRKRGEAEVEWERQKMVEGASNDAIDHLMELTGLKDVKEKFLDVKAKIETAERQGVDLKKERMGVVMLGNPGTGKTTVARIYAQFLASVGALPGKDLVEMTGSALANEGVQGTKGRIQGLVKAGGGVFFIDEAYQLASGSNIAGKSVLDFILAEIEERRGTIAFILAGYNKEMEKFFEHNPGFDSRMPHRLQFIDYSDEELLVMLAASIEKKYRSRAKLADGAGGLYARILIKRLGRKRGREGYGNARALENVWAQVSERQAARLRKERAAGSSPDDLFFTQEDLVGPEPSKAIKESKSWKELEALIGLEAIKSSVKALVDSIQLNYHRELKEKPPLEFTLHRVFLGSPGTGKTTVAQLYGSILADLGLLSKREVMIKNPSDFVGGALGQSEQNTKGILKASEGKVLVIDEAYGLDPGGRVGGQPDPYKTAVIDTIVAEVQNTSGEDRCVLLLGYKEQMEEMMNNCNPGLARRFRLSDAFHFYDFNNEELGRVLDLKIQKQGLEATDEAKKVAIEVLARERDRPNFGNAGAVENLLSRAKELEQKRRSSAEAISIDPNIILLPQDFDKDYDRGDRPEASCRELFADIVGCDKLIEQLEKYPKIAKNMRARGIDPRTQIPLNFLFKGPPGTGKTTVARKMGQLFYQMGIISTNECVDCSASDLVGQYVGQTGPKTQSKLTEALGRVLFVDEAYRFCDGGFGKEAINELVDSLTKPKFMGKIVVILAGYTSDMDNLLRINPGLSSRFPEEVIFSNMTPRECLVLLEKEIRRSDINLFPAIEDTEPVQYKRMEGILTELSKLPSWGNGRDVRTLAKTISTGAFANAAPSSSTLSVGTTDVLRDLEAMLKTQRARCSDNGRLLDSSRERQDLPLPLLTQDPPKPMKTTTATVTEMKPATSPPATEEANTPKQAFEDAPPGYSQQRDPGVSDEVWQQIQKSIQNNFAAEKVAQEQLLARERELQSQREIEAAGLEELIKLQELARQADEKRREEYLRQYEEEKARVEAALKAKREAEERLRKAREEEMRRKLQEQAIQKKLRDMGVCPAGFRWIKSGDGYYCGGGSHFMSNAQLGIN